MDSDRIRGIVNKSDGHMVINNISTRFYGSFQQQSGLSSEVAASTPTLPDERINRTPFSAVLRQTLENTEDSERQLAMLRIQSQAGPMVAAEVVREDGTINRIRLQQLLAEQEELARQLEAESINEPLIMDFEA